MGYFRWSQAPVWNVPPISLNRAFLVVAELTEGRASAQPGRAEARPFGMGATRPPLQLNRLALNKLSDEVF